MESIRLSALGRDVRIGDLYNYLTDVIVTNEIKVPKNYKHIERISNPEAQPHVIFQQPGKFKFTLLDVNSHLQQSIEENSIDLNQLWFADYLKSNTKEDDPNVALVTVFFQVAVRTEKLGEDFKFEMNPDGQASHIVEQVVFGAELICCMRKTVDWNRETKEDVEQNIYLAAKAYFDQAKESNFAPTDTELPAELDDVSCTILSNPKAVKLPKGSSIQMFSQLLKLLNEVVSGKLKEQPININLRPISEQTQNRISSKLLSEREFEIQLENERIFTMCNWIDDESYIMSMTQPSLDRIPPLKTALDQFRTLLQPLRNHIQKEYSKLIHQANLAESIASKTKEITNLLIDIIDWLIRKRKEIEIVTNLLSGTQLAMFDMKEIENRVISNTATCAKVFILKIDYNQDSLIESIQNKIGYSKPTFKFPAFPVAAAGEDSLKSISNMLEAFVYEARLSRWCSIHGKCYQIGLVAMSSPLSDGAIRYVKYGTKEKLLEIQTNLLTNDPPSRAPSPLPPPPPPISTNDPYVSSPDVEDMLPLPPPPLDSDLMPPPPPLFTSLFSNTKASGNATAIPPPPDHLRNLLFQDIRQGARTRLKPTLSRKTGQAVTRDLADEMKSAIENRLKSMNPDSDRISDCASETGSKSGWEDEK